MKTSTLIGILLAIVVLGGIGWYARSTKNNQSNGYTTGSNSNTYTGETSSQINTQSKTTTGATTTATSGTSSPVREAAAKKAVLISNFAFNPDTLSVRKGTTVIWTNEDTAPHTVTGTNGGPVSGTLSKGQNFSYTFNTAGTFSYYCKIHPQMKGVVKVTE